MLKITQLLCPTCRHTTNFEQVAMPNTDGPFFGAKLEAQRHKMFHIFSLFAIWYDFEIVSHSLYIFNAISCERSCLISVPFLTCELDVRTIKFFPPAESCRIGQFSDFPRASRMQGQLDRVEHEKIKFISSSGHVIFCL